MDVHRGGRLLHGPQQGQVSVAGVSGMDAALQANFGRAAVPGLERASGDLLEREVVRPTAQIIAQLALGECAEAAGIAAHVGVIDVAVDHVTDDIAAGPGAQRIGGGADLLDLRTSRGEQPNDIVCCQSLSSGCPIEQSCKTAKFARDRAAIYSLSPRARGEGRRWNDRARNPGILARESLR